MRERLPDKLRRKWNELKIKVAKWIIRKSVQWLDNLQIKSFMAYSWSLDEVTDYHVIAERSYKNCHVYGTKVEYGYYDELEEANWNV